MEKMINEGAKIAEQQQSEITDELVEETMNQKKGNAQEKLALAVVKTAEKKGASPQEETPQETDQSSDAAAVAAVS